MHPSTWLDPKIKTWSFQMPCDSEPDDVPTIVKAPRRPSTAPRRRSSNQLEYSAQGVKSKQKPPPPDNLFDPSLILQCSLPEKNYVSNATNKVVNNLLSVHVFSEYICF